MSKKGKNAHKTYILCLQKQGKLVILVIAKEKLI